MEYRVHPLYLKRINKEEENFLRELCKNKINNVQVFLEGRSLLIKANNYYSKETKTIKIDFLDLNKFNFSLKKNAKIFIKWGELILHYVVEKEPAKIKLGTHVAAIDYGKDNLVTFQSTNIDGSSFYISGLEIASKMEEFQEVVKGKKKGSKKYNKYLKKLKNFLEDFMKKAAVIIVDECLKQGVNKLILGHNKGIKNIAKQDIIFKLIPHSFLRKQIKSKCQEVGIEYIEVDESYTSLADATNPGEIIDLKDKKKHKSQSTNKRVIRDLVVSDYSGNMGCADLGATLNMLQYYQRNFDYTKLIEKYKKEGFADYRYELNEVVSYKKKRF